MNVEIFVRQIEEIHCRLAELYQGTSPPAKLVPELLLPTALKELGTASEELQAAAEELIQQTEQLAATQAQVTAERQRYQELFEFLPNAYLLTDAQGKIQEANLAAATLFNVEPHLLKDKLLISFVPPLERQVFRAKLARLQQSDWVQEWTVCLQPRNGEPFDATLTVSPVRNHQGNLVNLRWIVRDITVHKRVLKALKNDDYDPSEDRPKHFYSKGEIIPLEPHMIWLVRQGWVKLSTISETGEEVLMGLVGRSKPFGSSMTALPTYQAIALSETVELVSIALSEVADSPRFRENLFSQMNQRLRQTESLLAISGKRQVKERLHHFLLFLSQEIGQPIAQGTRLTVRLTHQDFADACCTTRVTITRLLGKLQQQGKIAFDSKHHILLIDESQQKCS
jgi:PAS domain S-box-containing protein